MCVFMWMYATGTQRSQRRVLGPLELQTVTRWETQVLWEQRALFTAEPQIASVFKKSFKMKTLTINEIQMKEKIMIQ